MGHDLDDEELEATRNKFHGSDKQKKAEETILLLKTEIERYKSLVDTMKRNVKENYISKLTIERRIEEYKVNGLEEAAGALQELLNE
jgi:hypothetical protein